MNLPYFEDFDVGLDRDKNSREKQQETRSSFGYTQRKCNAHPKFVFDILSSGGGPLAPIVPHYSYPYLKYVR